MRTDRSEYGDRAPWDTATMRGLDLVNHPGNLVGLRLEEGTRHSSRTLLSLPRGEWLYSRVLVAKDSRGVVGGIENEWS